MKRKAPRKWLFKVWLKNGEALRWERAAPFNSETAHSAHDARLEELVAFVPLEQDLLRRVAERRSAPRSVTLELGFGERAPHLEPVRDLPLRYGDVKRSPYTPVVQRSENYYAAQPAAPAPPPLRVYPIPPSTGTNEIRESDVAYVVAALAMGYSLESMVGAFASYRLKGDELLAELRRKVIEYVSK